jgi:hypothetical protein
MLVAEKSPTFQKPFPRREERILSSSVAVKASSLIKIEYFI